MLIGNMKGFSKILVCCLLLCVGCKEVNSSDEDLESRYFRLEKMGWKSRKYVQKADDINFTAVEVPLEYYFLKNEGSGDIAKVDSLYRQNNTERVIEFTFEQQDEKDLLDKSYTGMEYEDSIKYLSFGLQNDFYVVTQKKDTIACSGVTYERNFKIAPYQRALLFFSGIPPEQKIQLVYKDYLYRKGILKFGFKDTYTEIAL